ncbi:MAG TPA: nucleotidyltransferase [Actinomycetota bacterium]|nr:nucleotidyltransferase [Actinomycetota bacterium]
MVAPSVDVWEGQAEVEEAVFQRVLWETADVLRRSGIPHLFMGGVASAALGRPRWTHDIDVFVGPDDARRTLRVLASEGYETQETDPQWLYKALKDDVLVDVIFLSDGQVVLDEEMAARARPTEVEGIPLPVIGPEDLIVIKALVHKERSPRHWFDALALLRRDDLDWDYLLERSRRYNPLRVLSLLYYARSSDQVVPGDAIKRLREAA